MGKTNGKKKQPRTSGEIVREVRRSPNFVSLYANDVQVQTTPWDVRLILGEIGIEETDGRQVVHVQQTAELRMSLQLAKRLILIITEQLVGYEENFGPIPQPKS